MAALSDLLGLFLLFRWKAEPFYKDANAAQLLAISECYGNEDLMTILFTLCLDSSFSEILLALEFISTGCQTAIGCNCYVNIDAIGLFISKAKVGGIISLFSPTPINYMCRMAAR